jgi:hypothetical protein
MVSFLLYEDYLGKCLAKWHFLLGESAAVVVLEAEEEVGHEWTLGREG